MSLKTGVCLILFHGAFLDSDDIFGSVIDLVK